MRLTDRTVAGFPLSENRKEYADDAVSGLTVRIGKTAKTFRLVIGTGENRKRFTIGISFGSKVFVCSNLAFIGDHVIRRKHTANAKRELPGLLMEIIEPLALHREAQHRTFERYRHTELTEPLVDHAIMRMYREGVINVQRIPDVLKEWEEPTHEAAGAWTAWRLFNAATLTLAGRTLERPEATPKLHKIIDGVCEAVS